MSDASGRSTERVHAFLGEHPSIRRGLAVGIVNDAALARRVHGEAGGGLSVEAIAVALRREERVARAERAAGPAFPQLVGGATLQLLPDYALLRLRDEEAVWSRLAELRGVLQRGRRPATSMVYVEEGEPRISVLCPGPLVARMRRVVPPRSVVGVARGLALVVLEADQAANDTPGVIATLAELLAERGLVPGPLIAAGRRVSFAAPIEPARRAFEFLHELRRGPGPEPTAPDAQTLSPAAPVLPVASDRESARSGAEVARAYIEGHPSVADCLAYGVVNFTALARQIASETGHTNPEAIEAALRRSRAAHGRSETVEHRLLAVIRASRIDLRTRVALVSAPHSFTAISRILESDAARSADRRQLFQILQGPTSVTVLCDEELVASVLRTIGPRSSITATYDLSAVIVRSPPAIVETPGVLAYLSLALARAGLNCVELMSVQLESTFVVTQRDALEVFRVLSGLVHPPEAAPPPPAAP